MNNKEIPVENIKVKIKSKQGETLIGDLNINGFDRLSDFFEENTSDFIMLSDASINAQGESFVIIYKSNIAYIKPEEIKHETATNR